MQPEPLKFLFSADDIVASFKINPQTDEVEPSLSTEQLFKLNKKIEQDYRVHESQKEDAKPTVEKLMESYKAENENGVQVQLQRRYGAAEEPPPEKNDTFYFFQYLLAGILLLVFVVAIGVFMTRRQPNGDIEARFLKSVMSGTGGSRSEARSKARSEARSEASSVHSTPLQFEFFNSS